MTTPSLRIEVLESGLVLPSRAHAYDAGFDVRAARVLRAADADALTDDERARRAAETPDQPLVIAPGRREVANLGFRAALPPGIVADVRSRSGLAARDGVIVLNSPGTIDAGYRGEVKVILTVLGPDPVEIARGDRIAQVIVQRVELPDVVAVETLPDAGDDRGVGGFGSTGN